MANLLAIVIFAPGLILMAMTLLAARREPAPIPVRSDNDAQQRLARAAARRVAE